MPDYSDMLMRMIGLPGKFTGMMWDQLGGPDLGVRPLGEYQAESLDEYQIQDPWASAAAELPGVSPTTQAPLAATADVSTLGLATEKEDLVRQGAEKVAQLKDRARQAQLDELSSLVDDMPIDKLWKIRGQAAASSRQGRLGVDVENTTWPSEYATASSNLDRGAFTSQDEMDPRVQQRLDDNAAWLADQPIRDATFSTSAEMVRRDPYAAELASDRLPRLQIARTAERKALAQEKFISGMVGKSGKVPYEAAMQLMSGSDMFVPRQMIGMTPEQADAEVGQILENAAAGMMSRDVLSDPTGGKAQFEKYSLMLGKAAMEKLAAGGDRDVIVPRLRIEIRDLFISLGFGNATNIGAINKQLGIPEGQ